MAIPVKKGATLSWTARFAPVYNLGMRFEIARRWLVLAAYSFWLGGFVFYAAVVVPTGKAVLGSDVDQGFITRRVSVWINVAATATLTLFLLDLALYPSRRRWKLAVIWVGMAIAQAILFWLHPRMDAHMDVDAQRVLQRSVFRPMHKIYLWTHTVQWLMGCVYLALLLQRWRDEDRNLASPPRASQ